MVLSMKTCLTIALLGLFIAAAGALRAEPPAAYAMQQAVMVEQDVGTVERYLKEGFDASKPIGCGSFDALDGAVYCQNTEIAALLIKHGARPRESTFVEAAFGAAPKKAVEMVRLFLEAGASVNSKSRYSLDASMYWTALHRAVYRENVELVKLLLSKKGISVNDVNGDGHTALVIARQKKNAALIALLEGAGGR